MRRGELEQRARARRRKPRDPRGDGRRLGPRQTIGTLGAIARDAGDGDLAFELDRPRAPSSRASRRSVVGERDARGARCALAARRSRSTRRRRARGRSLALADRLRDRAGRVFGVGLLACVAAERGQSRRAPVVCGARSRARTPAHRSAGGGATARRARRGCAEPPDRTSSADAPRAARSPSTTPSRWLWRCGLALALDHDVRERFQAGLVPEEVPRSSRVVEGDVP